MDKFLMGIGAIILVFALIAVVAFAGGTIFYWVYPVFQAPLHLPALDWWQCVCLVWGAHILQRDNKATLSSK